MPLLVGGVEPVTMSEERSAADLGSRTSRGALAYCQCTRVLPYNEQVGRGAPHCRYLLL